jgi:hypothetical protein
VSSTYDYDRRLATDRPKYPDGRLIPQDGDEVYQIVPAMFGMSASIVGKVYSSRGGLRVKVTGGGALIGHAPIGKTYKLGPEWTVMDDPSIKAREEAKQREKLKGETSEQAVREEAAKTIDAEGKKRGLHPIHGIHDVHVGDTVYSLSSAGRFGRGDPHEMMITKGTVTQIEKDYFLYAEEDGVERTSGTVRHYDPLKPWNSWWKG